MTGTTTRATLRAALDRLPRVQLADLPTPLHDCPRFSEALGGKVSLWPLFKALERVPVLTVHGARSNILSDKTLSRMAETMPGMAQGTVEDCGHPPSLTEANVLEAIDAHLAPV